MIKLIKKHRVFLVLFALCYVAIMLYIQHVNSYIHETYLISYQNLGFVKRGLIGTILSPFAKIFSWHIVITTFSVIGLITFGVVMAKLMSKSIELSKYSLSSWILAICIIFSPCSLSALAGDLGRFDWILILILIATHYILLSFFSQESHPKHNFNVLFIVVLIMQVVGILVHEIYIMMIMPIIIYINFFKSISKDILYKIAAISIISLMLVFLFGARHDLSISEVNKIYISNEYHTRIIHDFNQTSLFVLKFNILDNLNFSVDRYKSMGLKLWIFIITNTFIIMSFLFYLTTIATPHLKSGKRLLITMLMFMPMLLSLIAVDIGRWITLSFFVGLIIIFSEKRMQSFKFSNKTNIIILGYLLLFLVMSNTRASGLGGIHDLLLWGYKVLKVIFIH